VKITVLCGDITDAPAEAVCTSTNARLSLMMGTGGSVRERGGFEILRECEAIVSAAGGALPVGSVHVTGAGKLPFRIAVHCVASDPKSHRSSEAVIRACVRNALAAADAASCASVAMPVFGTGHARFRFDRAAATLVNAIREAQTNVREVVIAVDDAEKAEVVRAAVG
jgi:O-acetyl-ADP-ribose deacetylase (regulator of RNase III)